MHCWFRLSSGLSLLMAVMLLPSKAQSQATVRVMTVVTDQATAAAGVTAADLVNVQIQNTTTTHSPIRILVFGY